MSSWPAFSRTLGSSVAHSFGSSRSMTSGITASPCLLQGAFSAASSRSTITTREPAANIASVLDNPMPDAAPGTTAPLPSNSLSIGLSVLGAVLLAPGDRIAPNGGVVHAIVLRQRRIEPLLQLAGWRIQALPTANSRGLPVPGYFAS